MATITEDYVSFEGFVPIKGYEEYLINKEGKVYSSKTKKFLGIRDRNGYLAFTVCVNSKRKDIALHRALAITFIPNPENLPFINHKDGNKHNNALDNLEWCTASENVRHAFDTGLKVVPKGKYLGKDNKLSKPFVCVETGKIYNCQRELWEEFGFDSRSCSHIARACKFGLLDHGFHWRYYEPNELVKLLFEKGYTKYPLSYDGDYWFCYVQMTMKWLRETHDIDVSIVPLRSHKEYLPRVESDTISYDAIPCKEYEDACETAIKYCLKNLI